MPDTYNRTDYDPFTSNDWDAAEAAVAAIRAEGHAIGTGHPRIFITDANKAALKTKIEGNAEMLATLQEGVDSVYALWGRNIPEFDVGGEVTSGFDTADEVFAAGIIYQLGAVSGIDYYNHPVTSTPLTYSDYGTEGARHIADFDQWVNNTSGNVASGGRYNHRDYLGFPLGYDWLYDLLSTDDKRAIGLQLLAIAEPDAESVRAYNNPPGARLLGALAVYGDGFDENSDTIDDAQPLIDHFHAGMCFGEPIDVHSDNLQLMKHFLFCPEGMGLEATAYSGRYHPIIPFLEAWYDQTGEDYFQLPFFQSYMYHFAHISAIDGTWYDKNKAGQGTGRFRNMQLGLRVALERTDTDAAALARHYYDQQSTEAGLPLRLFYMLRADPSIVAQTPTQIGLDTTGHYLVVNNILARNSWATDDATWAWFQCPDWTVRRNTGPTNDLVIRKYGESLLMKHQQRHDYAGGNRTNTIVAYDTNVAGVTFMPRNARDGGGTRTMGELPGGLWENIYEGIGGHNNGLKYFEENEDKFIYAFGDGEQEFQGYAERPTEDVLQFDGWARQWLWWRNANNDDLDIMVMIDRVENPNATTSSQIPLHFSQNPDIRDKTTNVSAGNGTQYVAEGIYKYTSSNRIVATLGGGRLFVDTLLPATPTYYRMGGLLERNIDLFGNLRRQSNDIKEDEAEDSTTNKKVGVWRVQMDAAKSGNFQTYLNVLQVADSATNTPNATVLLQDTGIIGAACDSRLALFADSETYLNGETVTVPAGVSGAHEIFLADLDPDVLYDITVAGVQVNVGNTSPSRAGAIYISAATLAEGNVIGINSGGAANDIRVIVRHRRLMDMT